MKLALILLAVTSTAVAQTPTQPATTPTPPAATSTPPAATSPAPAAAPAPAATQAPAAAQPPVARPSTPPATPPPPPEKPVDHNGLAYKNPKSTLPKVVGLPHVLYSLRYVDIKVGTGPLAEPRNYLTVKYSGWFTDGTKFDSSYDHTPPDPITFPYGARRVIPGWDSGFEGMRVGGKRRLYVPYQLGYGPFGDGRKIAAKANLIFDMELVSMTDKPPAPPAGSRPQMPPGGARPGLPGGMRPGMPGAPASPAGSPAPGTPPATGTPSTPPAPATPTAPPAPAKPATPPSQ